MEPTLQNVREKLGTGSFATISSHLKKWRELKIKESPIPEQPQSFLSATKQIWATAWREAENTFEEQKKALFIEKEQILKEVERLEVETSTNKTTIKDLKTLLGQEKGFREKVARLQAQLESSEERRKEALSRGNRLEKELASIARKKRARA